MTEDRQDSPKAQEEAQAWVATVAAALDVASRVAREAEPGVAKMIPELPERSPDIREPVAAAEHVSIGMERMLLSGIVAYERLPMLEIVFDRLVRTMSTSLRNFTSDNVEVVFRGLASLRFGDYIDNIPNPSILAVFKAEQWDNYGLVMVDAPLIYSMVDVLLGGRPTSLAASVSDRSFTTIERQLVERMIDDVLLRDLSDAFAPLTEVRFRFERLEVILAFKPDMLAVETIPNVIETKALANVLKNVALPAWFSFTAASGSKMWSGEHIEDAATEIAGLANLVAAGVNCLKPIHVAELTRKINAITGLPAIAYPNDGGKWDPETNTWYGQDSKSLVDWIPEWKDTAIEWVGGCCGINANEIARVKLALGKSLER